MGEIVIDIAGNAAELRTEAEILWRSEGKEVFLALVFDSSNGWKTEIENAQLAASIGTDFNKAVEKSAREAGGLREPHGRERSRRFDGSGAVAVAVGENRRDRDGASHPRLIAEWLLPATSRRCRGG